MTAMLIAQPTHRVRVSEGFGSGRILIDADVAAESPLLAIALVFRTLHEFQHAGRQPYRDGEVLTFYAELR